VSIAYTEEQKELIALVRQMAEAEIKPHVQEADRAGFCPQELFEFGFDMGIHLAEIPKEYGGLGLSFETCALIFEELAKVDAGYAITFVTSFVALRNVILAGTPEQTKYFSEILKQKRLAAFALTEPNAGSNSAGIRGAAIKDGDDYILNASKTFITNGSIASVYVAFFKTDPSAGNKGISAFIVDRDTPGVSVGSREDKMGLRLSDTSEVFFDDVRVSKSCLLGEEGAGYKLSLNALNLSRAFVSTMALGIMERALDEACAYAKDRKTFGDPIIEFQMVQSMLADMAIKIEASRCLINNTMKLIDAGSLVRMEGAICKTFVSDALQEVTSNAVQVLGGYGYSREYPVEKLMRDAKVFQIFEGTNQIQRVAIANMLKAEA
jgi:alkylation response protein AidB-like acyl-CoA dehydrogenase